jgi:hypothetical protein
MYWMHVRAVYFYVNVSISTWMVVFDRNMVNSDYLRHAHGLYTLNYVHRTREISVLACNQRTMPSMEKHQTMPKRRPAAACRPSGPLNSSHAHHRGWRPGDRPCSAQQERLCTHRETQARHGSAGWTGCAASRSVCGQGGARLARAGAPRMQGMRFGTQGPWVRRACTPAAAGGGTGGSGSERRHFCQRPARIEPALKSM